MNHYQPWNSYKQVSAQTASPGQLVLMLYDGAIRFMERALQGFNNEDPLEFNQTISNNLIRAQSILGELNSSLNMEQGGDLAQTLRRLYEYMDDRLTESNVRKTPDGVRDTIRRLTIIRDAWQLMLQRRAAETARPREEMAGLCACG